MKPKRKTKKPLTKQKVDVDQILLQHYNIFLYDVINHEVAQKVVKQLIALDKLAPKDEPLVMWINSPGGSVSDGLSIIDTMNSLKSPVVTIITGMAASMAGVIATCGYKRIMTANSIWMSHDISGGIGGDYATKVLDRVDFIKWSQNRIFSILRNHTKLTEKELTKARHGELWLDAMECKNKGIVDVVI